tara:strand:- start:193 stop:426 length:234 start_codon:yes stop_codon:yes gene_type:complete
MVNAVDRKRIEKEARELLQSFGEALADVEVPSVVGEGSGEGMRAESADECDAGFRELMMKNAPKVKGDCLVAEKKSW